MSQNEEINKMSLYNLAVVFGPTLLRPAAGDSQLTAVEHLCQGTNEVMMQTMILLYFLNLKAQNFNFPPRP